MKKNIIGIIMAVTLVSSSIFFPVQAYADDVGGQKVDINDGTIETNNGTVETNNGTVETNTYDGKVENNTYGGKVATNNGTVVNNDGTVENNNGTVNNNGNRVEVNNDSGTVENNIGTVGTNNGKVEVNYGTVVNNMPGGIVEINYEQVETNKGTVETNDGAVKLNQATVTSNKGKVVTNDTDATITNNFGTVDSNKGTVVNNFGGTVTNEESGTITNQWYEYELYGCSLTSSSEYLEYADSTWIGRAESTDDNLGDFYITVTPNDGYIFNNVTVNYQEVDSPSYIENADGSVSFGHIDELNGSIGINFQMNILPPATTSTADPTPTPTTTEAPIVPPMEIPTATPQATPSSAPTATPTSAPTATPTPSMAPSPEPTVKPINPDSTDPTERFSDVPADKWYSKPDGPISYVIANGIMKGTGDGSTFEPESPCTREMFVQILYNAEGMPGAGPSNPFSDVKSGKWYYNAVTWALANKVTSGKSATLFGIGENVTREQLAQFLMNYAANRGFNTKDRADLIKFPDAGNISGWAKNAISWANANGIINGKAKSGANYLDPKGNATRAETAQMVMAFQKRFGK